MFRFRALFAPVAMIVLVGHAWAAPGWIWLDERGQKVYSDIPPPASVPAQKVLQQPAAKPALAHSAAPEVAAPAKAEPPAAAAPVNAAPEATAPTAAQRKAEADAKALERKNAEIRAENCRNARSSLATLSSGGRLAMVNASGQQVVMDEAMINAERARVNRVIADNCK